MKLTGEEIRIRCCIRGSTIPSGQIVLAHYTATCCSCSLEMLPFRSFRIHV